MDEDIPKISIQILAQHTFNKSRGHLIFTTDDDQILVPAISFQERIGSIGLGNSQLKSTYLIFTNSIIYVNYTSKDASIFTTKFRGSAKLMKYIDKCVDFIS